MERYTLEEGERLTGVPKAMIRQLAHEYARADRAMLCWTLGITEHHNAVDNVLALINLALLTGHVGRYGSGLNPLRGQNNVQGGGDMGAIPNKYPGFQDVEDASARAKFEQAWKVALPPRRGFHLTQMFEAMERGDLTALYVIGENPAQSEADMHRAVRLMEGLEHLVVQDIFLTKTAQMADVVLPAAAAWCESEGTVTSSERRVQRVRKALDAAGRGARGHRDSVRPGPPPRPRVGRAHPGGSSGTSCARSPRCTPGMSYERLEALGGIQWPCPDESHPGSLFLHGRLWEEPVRGPLAPLSAVEHDPPVDVLDHEFPIRLTTGRRLDSYNTGVQTAGYSSPLRRSETLDLSPEDARTYGLAEGERVRVVSRRGAVLVDGAPGSRAAPRPRLHDPPFPRRGRDQPPHHRRGRPQVGHRRVQGHRDPHREGEGRLMDLHLSDAKPSAAEKRAIDAVLGTPRTRGDGGKRGPATDGHAAQGGHEDRARRHLLLPALHAAQDRVGWISEGALNYVCRRLTVPPAEAYGVATFYGMFSLERRAANVAHVCDDVVCRLQWSRGALCADEGGARPRGEQGPEGCKLGPEPVPRPVRAGSRGARHPGGGASLSA